jgi:hypothetical protein
MAYALPVFLPFGRYRPRDPLAHTCVNAGAAALTFVCDTAARALLPAAVAGAVGRPIEAEATPPTLDGMA